MDAELLIPPMISWTLAAFLGWLLPRFSRNLLGPAVIVLTVAGCIVYVNQAAQVPSDAWGPAALIIALYVGGVGLIAGLILVIVGALRVGRVGASETRSSYPYSKERPYRMPQPGLFTPGRVFACIVLVEIVVTLAVFL